jgi:hypothetical protein
VRGGVRHRLVGRMGDISGESDFSGEPGQVRSEFLEGSG